MDIVELCGECVDNLCMMSGDYIFIWELVDWLVWCFDFVVFVMLFVDVSCV